MSSVSRKKPVTFREENFQDMYHLLQSMVTMDAAFTKTSSSANSRDILKSWVKESSKLRTMPRLVYKTMILRKAYQYLVIFACFLYSQESTETFPQSWVITLDQLASEGKACNWSDMLAHRLKEWVTGAQKPPKGQQEEIYMSAYILDAIYPRQ